MNPAGIRSIIVLTGLAALAGCGTTTSLQKPGDAEAGIDLAGYDQVIVANFTNDATSSKAFKGKTADEKRVAHQADTDAATNTFADMIVAELIKTDAFSQVGRGESPQAGALWIDGRITRFEKGSAAARLFVGMGAGSSYFDATVNVKDAATGNTLGTIVVDKNSWVLGGGLAAGQSVEGFMRGGAKKVATELQEAKLGPSE